MTLRSRLVLIVLAVWSAVSVSVALSANSNFRTVDRLLAPGYRPEHDQEVLRIGHDPLRLLYRYFAGELNRQLFRRWAFAQVVLALLLASALYREPGTGRGARVLAWGGLGLGLVLALVLTPMMLKLGPPFDFLPRPVPPEWAEAHRRFLRLHGLYFALDLLKVLMLLAALVLALRPGQEKVGVRP